MKILYANVIEKNKFWGAEWFMNNAFQELGIKTKCIDFRSNRSKLFSDFSNIETDFDFFFLQRGDYFPRRIINSINRPRFFWVSELVSRRNDFHHLLSSNQFNHIFFRTNICIENARKIGEISLDNTSVLLSAFDNKIHKIYPNYEKKLFDVVFIGSINPRRKKVIEKIEKYFSINTFSLFGKEMSKVFNQSKIVINIHSDNDLDVETRVFEVLGSGAFLLSEKLSIENPFSTKDLIEYENVNDLLEKINYYLHDDEKRNQIAKNGYQNAISHHTYLKRAEHLVKIFNTYSSNKDNFPIEKRNFKKYIFLEKTNIYNKIYKIIK